MKLSSQLPIWSIICPVVAWVLLVLNLTGLATGLGGLFEVLLASGLIAGILAAGDDIRPKTICHIGKAVAARPARQRIIAHSDRRDKHGVGADEHPFADGGAVLHHPVVIAGDSPRADVGAFAHIGIAQIGQMADLHAFVQNGVLDLDEIADMHILGQFCAGAQPGKGADLRATADMAAFQMAKALDLGLAFDGDADRVFVIDENGDAVTPSAVAAIVARREIAREQATNPGAPITVLHNLLTSRVVEEVIAADGAKPVKTRVGHSLIKDKMAETNAIFGGEHSAHYYFRDFWGADNGMLAAMHVLAEFGSQERPLSEFAKQYNPYFMSGEINSTVSDVAAAKARVVEAFADRATFDEFDGITAQGKPAEAGSWWWFNVRASNTEPLLRLNVEASNEDAMTQIRNEVLSLIQQKA